MGEMADFLAETLYDDDDEDGESYYYEPQPKTCNRCGKKNLYWKNCEGRWRLFDIEEKQHICKILTPSYSKKP